VELESLIMLRGQDILCISSIDWDQQWQIHHEIMTTLAAHGNRVLYVENTGVRRLRVSDVSRVRQRVRNWWRGTKGFREERENLFVYSPLFLPFPYSRVARWINRVLLFRGLRRWMHATSFRRPVVWTFLPTPLALDMIDAVDARLVVYHCADDFSSSSPGARRVTRSEVDLLKRSDIVFVTSERLRERAAVHAGSVHRFPAGVNFDEFDRVRQDGARLPEDLGQLPRPIVGYVGGLHQWLDQALLLKVAARMPAASFVLVGPSYTDTSALAGGRNVHLLGERPHGDMPHYIRAFDVGIVPYRLNEYTDSVYPVKLNEYFAMGIPVVATGLPEIRRFNAEHGNLVAIAADAEDFSLAIARAVGGSSDGEVAQRVAVARHNGWPARIAAMSKIIEEAIARRGEADGRWDERLKRLYRRARRRTAQAAVAAAAAYLLLFHTPLVWWAAEPLRVAQTPVPADAIVVFAGGVGESGKAGGGYQERVKQAVDLYRQGLAKHVIFSSGYVFAFREAEIMRDLAVANGVPAEAVVLEQRAANTYQNVVYSNEILQSHGWRSILLVSSPYHMRRGLLVWHRAAPQVVVVATPVPQSQFYEHGAGANLEQIRGLLQEYLAIARYWTQGKI
jgi:uncharacterized SAM-binding protein YcdF (DUF218 family)/glycosyltransferase involved in cell wall biosynthesis